MKAPIDLIGNAHIDPVWLWQWQDGFAEIKATYRAALDRMNEFTGFIFTSACAAYFDWIEQNAPEMFAQIVQRVHEGRFAIVGGFWIQPDCNIPSGESFCRQALYAQRYFQSRFGLTARVGYNVDSFGHNGMLPQICKKAGMDSYVFMRPGIHEKDIPDNLFIWRSPDGSEVSAYRIPMSYDDRPDDVDFSVYGDLNIAIIKILETQRIVREHGLPEMCFYGVGNHGGGPTITSLKAIEAFCGEHPGEVRYSTPDMYFRSAPREGLHILEGDLQHHGSGCYSANSQLKMLNRKAENRLLTAEKLMSLAYMLMDHAYEADLLERAWRKLLFNQFHDTLAGCCIKAACIDAIEQFGESINIANELSNAAFQKIAWNIDTSGGEDPVLSKENDGVIWEREKRGVPVVLFNPHSFPVRIPVEIGKELAGVTKADGTPVMMQKIRGAQTNRHKLYSTLLLADLPPMGYATYWIFKSRTFELPETKVSASDTHIENERLLVTFSPETGNIASIVDKATGGNLLAGAVFAQVIDETDSDTWAHGIFSFDKEIGRFGQPRMRLVESGPLRAALRVEQRFEDTILTQDYSLFQGSAQVDVQVRMDVRMKHQQIKLCFPLPGDHQAPVYSMPYGYIAKSADGLEEPAQQWVAAARGDAPTFALLNNGKYSYSMKDNLLRMTIVRTPGYADHFGQRDDLMEYTDQGIGEFKYAIMPVPEDYAQITRHARVLNQMPDALVETYHRGVLPTVSSAIQVLSDRIICEVLKRAEDGSGYVLRLFEAGGKEAVGVVIHCAGREMELDFAPHEIVTMLLPDDKMQPVRSCLITELA